MSMNKIQLKLFFGDFNGTMSLKIQSKGHPDIAISDTAGVYDVCLSVDFPNTVRISLTGKRYDSDTEILSNGTYGRDKHVKLLAMSVGDIPVSEKIMFDICEYQPDTDDMIRNDTYWGFNGIVILNFDSLDAIFWNLSRGNQFDF